MHGADEVVRALEDEGVRFTFGIPGTHNIELYDALERSEKVTAILVTDEQSASFMADAVSRTSESIGVANVVPGAGVSHCLSGVAEAFMDNVPLVVLTCGIRNDTGKAYQLHDVDQLAMLAPVTKARLTPASPGEIHATVRRAFAIARSGAPGPVAVEIPANFYLLDHAGPAAPFDGPGAGATSPAPPAGDAVEAAARILDAAAAPAIYVGHGARGAAGHVRALAEKLQAPVTSTIQGKGVFPESHPLWLWPGFGPMAPAFASDVFGHRDALLAVGCRFGEVATASYGAVPPANLIHVDIDPAVFHKNFPARLAVASDAAAFLEALVPRVRERPRDEAMLARIAEGHAGVRQDWRDDASRGGVTPAAFFAQLQKAAGPRAIYASDSGNGTFLAMEHLRLDAPGLFIGPIDYSCMGYAVPAAIGARLANPDRNVVALAGDGALLMTGLELLTAAGLGLPLVVCVLADGELGQIVQFQRTTLDRDTCTVLHPYELRHLAKAVGARFVAIHSDAELEAGLTHAIRESWSPAPVVVEVAIDYTRRTYFTRGVVTTNFWRLPMGDRVRMVARAAGRKLAGLFVQRPDSHKAPPHPG